MRRSSVASALATSVLTAVLVAPTVCAADPLVIHEWGTFTSLQDEQGRTIGGLNVDEEHLPAFVHDLRPVAMGKDGDFAPRLVKGVAACHPSVTMRLETPVVYVHLPAGQDSAVFDLTVEFRGGFLSQFYPSANAVVDGAPLRWRGEELQVETRRPDAGLAPSVPTWARWSAPDLTAQSRSMLTWRGVRATRERITPPATTSPVWLAPRKVDAAGLTVGEQQERYLFYRGLAHLDAPLRTMRVYPSTILQVGVSSQALSDRSMTSLPALWFADLRGDGTAAFRRAPATSEAHGFIDTAFTPDQYSTEALAGLRRELHAALVEDGLFADEAEALLATWEASYFRSAGQRLFFLVPTTWTERVLPLSVTVPAKVTRTMVGRIEVVSPEQRRAVERIAAGPVSDLGWFARFQTDHISYRDGDQVIHRPGGQRMFKRVFIDNDRGLLTEKRVDLPEDYRAYLSLGRFRDALLWEAQRQAPDPEIARFLRTYVLTWIPLPWQAQLLAGQPTAAASVP